MKVHSYAINLRDVVDEVIDGEAILINLKSGSYYSIEGTACLLWEWLKKGTRSSDDLARFMKQHFDGDGQSMSDGAHDFLEEMMTEGLLHMSADEAEPITDENPENRVAYTPPVLSKYTDMEALLLIDPIHDVTPKGWPESTGRES